MMLFLECLAVGAISFAICAIFSMIIGYFRGEDENENLLYSWITSCVFYGSSMAVIFLYISFKIGG